MDRGDALEQVVAFVGFAMLVYWLAFMDHADDGLPDDDPYPKFWKRSERQAVALGHAARIDPGVSLALRVDALNRLGVGLDIPAEVLAGHRVPLILDDPPAKNIYGIDSDGLLAWYHSLSSRGRVASANEGDAAGS